MLCAAKPLMSYGDWWLRTDTISSKLLTVNQVCLVFGGHFLYYPAPMIQPQLSFQRHKDSTAMSNTLQPNTEAQDGDNDTRAILDKIVKMRYSDAAHGKEIYNYFGGRVI
jgi:hypothetical protein